jgi:hypothetical protein
MIYWIVFIVMFIICAALMEHFPNSKRIDYSVSYQETNIERELRSDREKLENQNGKRKD